MSSPTIINSRLKPKYFVNIYCIFDREYVEPCYHQPAKFPHYFSVLPSFPLLLSINIVNST